MRGNGSPALFGKSYGDQQNEVIAEYNVSEQESQIDSFQTSDPHHFGKTLSDQAASLFLAAREARAREVASESAEKFQTDLRLSEEAIAEIESMIDWEVLRQSGLSEVGRHREFIMSTMASSVDDGGHSVFASKPSILPTLGVGIGMLLSVYEWILVARDDNQSTFPHAVDFSLTNALRRRLVESIGSLDLSDDERREAIFATKAAVVIARRHQIRNLG